jgi:hypothetical protein
VYATVNDVITRIPFLVVCSFVQLYCGVYLDRMLFGPFVLFGTNPVLIRALLALYVRIFLGILTHTINVRFLNPKSHLNLSYFYWEKKSAIFNLFTI